MPCGTVRRPATVPAAGTPYRLWVRSTRRRTQAENAVFSATFFPIERRANLWLRLPMGSIHVAFALHGLPEPSVPGFQTFSRSARNFKQIQILVEATRMSGGCCRIEVDIGQQIDFIQEHDSGPMKQEGYFSGLSSPSVTLKRAIFASSPQSNSTGQTRLPTFSIKRMSI